MGLAAGDPIRGLPPGVAPHRVRLPRDWQTLAARAEAHGYGVGALPMAIGRPWVFVRRGTEFATYQCMVAPLESSHPTEFRLKTGAYVMRLKWSSQSGRVKSVEYVDRRTGAREQLHGRAVVVAAGTIDTTVILLRSTSSDFPDGLGNLRGLLGRYLHDHPREWWTVETSQSLTSLAHPVYVAATRPRRKCSPGGFVAHTRRRVASRPPTHLLRRTGARPRRPGARHHGAHARGRSVHRRLGRLEADDPPSLRGRHSPEHGGGASASAMSSRLQESGPTCRDRSIPWPRDPRCTTPARRGCTPTRNSACSTGGIASTTRRTSLSSIQAASRQVQRRTRP